MKKNYHPKHLPHPNVPQHSKTPPTKTPFFFRNICHFSLAALLSTFLLQSDSLTDKNISKITNPIINNIDNDYISRNDSIRNIYHVIYPSLSNSNTLELTQEISNYLKNNTDSTDRVSLYIEELSTNYKLTSKQNELFMSASLGKVYVLMAALYRSQTHEGFLDEMIYYKNPSSVILPQTISDEFVLQEGNTYPVSVLLKNMISHSDNISYYLVDDHLLKSIDPSNKTVGRDRELPDFFREYLTSYDPDENYLSTVSYMTLFKELHQPNYLTEDMANYALSFLGESSYKDGLVKYLPVSDSVRVYYKFGEKDNYDSDKRQLHEGGLFEIIINSTSVGYYTFCVMIESVRPFSDLATIIADLSEIVYDFFARIYREHSK